MNIKTRRRITTVIFSFIILLIGTLIFKKMSSQKESTISGPIEKQDIRPVETTQFELTNSSYNIDLDGRLIAFEQVNLFSEVTGRLLPTKKVFKEGTYYQKGELIFKIDDTDAKYNLLAQKSSLLNTITQIMPDLKFDYPEAFDDWKKYLDEYDVELPIKELPEIQDQQVKYYVAGRNIYNQYYTIKSLEDRLSDYMIYAPFSGIVTVANTYTGALVSPGANLGTFINTSSYELKAPIPLSDLKYIKTGQVVNLRSDALEKEWTGKVSRLSSIIDPTTQNLPIYISVSGRGLSEGMYLKGTVRGASLNDVIQLPEELIVEQNKVFVVKDSVAMKKNLEVLNIKDGYYFVQGIAPDDKVISSPLNGIFEGQKVNIKN